MATLGIAGLLAVLLLAAGCGGAAARAVAGAGAGGAGGGVGNAAGGAAGGREAGTEDAPEALDASEDAAGEVADDAGTDAASDTLTGLSPARTKASAFTGTFAAGAFTAASTSWSRALASAGGRVVSANPDSDSITVLAGAPLSVWREVAVGRDPRSVALTADGRHAVVVNRGDGTVSVVDLEAGRELYYFATTSMPYAAVLGGGRLFVSEWATGHVVAFDPVTRTQLGRTPVAAFPAGLAHCGPPACALPAGRGLLVTHFYSGRLSHLDPDTLAVRAEISTGADTNLSQHVAIALDGKRAYLPQTRFFADNPTRQFDTTVFPVVNVVDLATFAVSNGARITLDTADRPVAMPFAVDFLDQGRRLVVANAASDDLSIIDLASGFKVAHVEVGASPQAVFVSDDGTLLVNETLDGNLRAIPSGDLSRATVLPVTTLPLAPALLRGKKLFWSASRTDLARDQWMACATCHFDGLHDGRTWRSFPDGIRNTTALFDLAETAPFHWSGDLDELEDVEATVRFVQAGKGLSPAPRIDTLGDPLVGASADLTALATFLRSLRAPVSPYRQDEAGIARGAAAFERLGCAGCHLGPHLTDRRNHDVGTGDPVTERNSHGRGLTFDTPALRALWLTAPYLHDGSAATLDDLLLRGPAHDLTGRASAAERADLITFLRSL